MGKRAPKADKADKAETKKADLKEESPAEEAHFEVFTPKFYETLDSFKNFYKEVLALRAKDGDSTGFNEVSKRVSDKLEEESGKILKEELADLEGWIQEQQGKLAGETTKIEEAYKTNSTSLANTRSFTEEEIRRQLQPIQAKIDEKNATHASFGELLKRAKDIYE
jgi:hypothetical protein